MRSARVYCSTFIDTRYCCGSCHEDGYDLLEAPIEGLEGISEVCCTVHQWIEENPEKAKEKLEESLNADLGRRAKNGSKM